MSAVESPKAHNTLPTNTTPPLDHVQFDRVGIVMMSAVGDVVHVLPIIHALKAFRPSMKLTWVLQPGPATLVRGHPLVDDIVLFNRSAGWKEFLRIRESLSTRPFDLVLGLQVYFKAGLITSFAKAPVKLGFDRERARDANWLFTTHRIPPHSGQHVQDQYFEFLTALGVPFGAPQWTLGPWNDEERAWQQTFIEQFDRPIAPIVVATSKAAKDWAPQRWAKVCNALWHDFGLQPVLVGGRSEREVAAESIIMREAPVSFSALGSGLRKLSAIFDSAAVVLSPDTGPLHMAVALRTPVISLMGYTNPKRVGPYDYSQDLMIDAYGDPGEDYPLDMSYREGRMDRITPDDVLQMVERWKDRYRDARLARLSSEKR